MKEVKLTITIANKTPATIISGWAFFIALFFGPGAMNAMFFDDWVMDILTILFTALIITVFIRHLLEKSANRMKTFDNYEEAAEWVRNWQKENKE